MEKKAPVPPAEEFAGNEANGNPETHDLLKLRTDDIRVSATYNREPVALEDDRFEVLKHSIATHGQDEPVRVRYVDGAYELIAGHRRLEACRQLGNRVVALLTDVTDERDAELLKWRENAEREDLSAYEKWRLFQSWLDTGLFASQAAIADAIGLTKARLSQIFAIADLPDTVVNALQDRRNIQVKDALKYRRLRKKYEDFDAVIEARARHLDNRDDRQRLDYLLAEPRKVENALTEIEIDTGDGKPCARLIRSPERPPRVRFTTMLSEEQEQQLIGMLRSLFDNN
ncbi:ParB/RepB/Spo0J family partition protein [Thiolapillus sp.]|uniref:ParB/RepB/Spo0J family partition protein n=3 Tax=Thiolapillus sp. TaxID=2017437 RepID=UPI0025E4B998|nr:ParB/RepB/Spo0J family partition protein [Thiolapillus sp.]